MDSFRTPASTGRRGFFVAPRALVAVAAALLIVLAPAPPAAEQPPAPQPRAPTTNSTTAPTAAPTPTTAPTTAPTPAPTTPPSPSSAAVFPLTLTDDEGTVVELPAMPQKIVSLTPAVTETLFAIGAGDRLVGKVEDVANFPPEAADVPVVGTFAGVDVEQIVALESDLIFAGGAGHPARHHRAAPKPRPAGRGPVCGGHRWRTAQHRTRRVSVGQRGRSPRPDRLHARGVRPGRISPTREPQRPSVFYETGDQPAIYGVADDSFIASMIELAGADPITTGSPTNWEMPLERLVDADPEVILLGDAAYGVTPEAVRGPARRADLAAVKAGAIHPIDDIIVTRPGPRLVAGLEALVAAIHPDVVVPAAT